jgi:NTP pyrophosphatase (non-canonical NTP hydrolase)
MQELISAEYQDLIYFLQKYFEERGTTLDIQIHKLTEEVGEVAKARIGELGVNPRLGVCATREDVVQELADVAITALVGIVFCGAEPNAALGKQAQKTIARLEQGGAPWAF